MLLPSTTLFLFICLFSGCQWDSYTKSLRHGYEVSWADLPVNRNISREGGGMIIRPHVYEVGYNREYIIAKRHPVTGTFGNEVSDISTTLYYIIRMEIPGEQEQKIWGAMKESMFRETMQILEIADLEFTLKYEVDDN